MFIKYYFLVCGNQKVWGKGRLIEKGFYNRSDFCLFMLFSMSEMYDVNRSSIL